MKNIKKKLKKNKEGAASFYVVVFATLILLVVVISFASVIANEMAKSSNDDLSQSAYDSAMAGVEDAKLAYYEYEKCLAVDELNRSETCRNIIQYAETGGCDMVKNILGRNDLDLVETNTGATNNMQQDYTCTTFDDTLGDVRGSLSSSNTTKVVEAKFDNGVQASEIKSVRISWYTDESGADLNFRNFDGDKVTFTTSASTPPTISLALLQTAGEFSLSDFDTTVGERTDRGMVYLVPTNDETAASVSKEGNYVGAYKKEERENRIGTEGFLKSNDKTVQNNPYAVYCNSEESDDEFLCSVTIELPEPINGNRNNDTFMFVVGSPYGKSTDFSMEFYCDGSCSGSTEISGNMETNNGENNTSDNSSQALLKGVQVDIDSTGKANDLYRRVAVRLEDSSDYALSIFGPLELLGTTDSNGLGVSLQKQLVVTSEYNF